MMSLIAYEYPTSSQHLPRAGHLVCAEREQGTTSMRVCRLKSGDAIEFGSQIAVTIGNFDGCHLGHQGLISLAKDTASERGLMAAALTFSPRPEDYFRGQPGRPLLFTMEQKIRAAEELGLDLLIIQEFDDRFSSLSPEQFAWNYLVDQLGAAAVIVGENFRFGHGRAGYFSMLEDLGAAAGFTTLGGGTMQWDGETISSSRIRAALQDLGQVEKARSMLGRPYLLEGVIEQGDQLGRTLKFPTANLGQCQQLLPRPGVYAGFAAFGADAKAPFPVMQPQLKQLRPTIFNIGQRPTVSRDESQIRIEGHVLNADIGTNELYGQAAAYYLTNSIRPEQRFADLDALKAQIAKDCNIADELLGALLA